MTDQLLKDKSDQIDVSTSQAPSDVFAALTRSNLVDVIRVVAPSSDSEERTIAASNIWFGEQVSLQKMKYGIPLNVNSRQVARHLSFKQISDFAVMPRRELEAYAQNS